MYNIYTFEKKEKEKELREKEKLNMEKFEKKRKSN